MVRKFTSQELIEALEQIEQEKMDQRISFGGARKEVAKLSGYPTRIEELYCGQGPTTYLPLCVIEISMTQYDFPNDWLKAQLTQPVVTPVGVYRGTPAFNYTYTDQTSGLTRTILCLVTKVDAHASGW